MIEEMYLGDKKMAGKFPCWNMIGQFNNTPCVVNIYHSW